MSKKPMKPKKTADEIEKVRKTQETREETDALGKIAVPKENYAGAFTERAKKNFQISGQTASKEFKKSLGLIKIASAEANEKLGLLDKKISGAIKKAAEEFIKGTFDNEYQLDLFQAGAGTPFNMNANEIIANRANEILGGEKGKYEFVHPNNHVNRSQSSNDVIPTAIRLTIVEMAPELIHECEKIIAELKKNSQKFSKILKTGRTHLQDAVPMTAGQEFGSYAAALKKDLETLKNALKKLREISLGGTALGTGINTHPAYRKTVTKILSALTNLKLIPGKNLFELTSNMNIFLEISGAYRLISTTLQRIAEDFKILSMSGIGEIILPEVEPGSSIMPGKINPSICECIQMIACQVIGNDTAIGLACQKGQLELNVMTPLILKNMCESTKILTNGIKMFRELCIEKIQINEKRCAELLAENNCVATALAPEIGYHKTAELILESRRTHRSIEKICEEKKILSKEKIAEILDAKNLTDTHAAKRSVLFTKKIRRAHTK